MDLVIRLCVTLIPVGGGGFVIWLALRREWRRAQRRREAERSAAMVEGCLTFLRGPSLFGQGGGFTTMLDMLRDPRPPETAEAAYRRGYRDGMLVSYNEFIGVNVSQDYMDALWRWMLTGGLFDWMIAAQTDTQRVLPPEFVIR